jgi:hypothetical protein
MPSKAAYLVRRENGTMLTIIAHTTRGAAKLFIHKYRPPKGEQISVKLRGGGELWDTYTIT